MKRVKMECFAEVVSKQIYEDIEKLAHQSGQYTLACSKPENNQYEFLFIKELYLVCIAITIRILLDYFMSANLLQTMKDSFFVHYVEKILCGKMNEEETLAYMRSINEYLRLLLASDKAIATSDCLFSCRKHFHDKLNAVCGEKEPIFSDKNSPIVASVFGNTYLFVIKKLQEVEVEFDT